MEEALEEEHDGVEVDEEGLLEERPEGLLRRAAAGDGDPDLAGIVPGPQPNPWGDDLDDLNEPDEGALESDR